ncbi:MAG: hypothetical protein HW380_3502 [Magnetococcales bacterium]|nr:hypothetical protein [Magnetococcales bacterium]
MKRRRCCLKRLEVVVCDLPYIAGVKGNLILTLILLPPKGGLGAQPQGFDFVSLPEGHHVPGGD